MGNERYLSSAAGAPGIVWGSGSAGQGAGLRPVPPRDRGLVLPADHAGEPVAGRAVAGLAAAAHGLEPAARLLVDADVAVGAVELVGGAGAHLGDGGGGGRAAEGEERERERERMNHRGTEDTEERGEREEEFD